MKISEIINLFDSCLGDKAYWSMLYHPGEVLPAYYEYDKGVYCWRRHHTIEELTQIHPHTQWLTNDKLT